MSLFIEAIESKIDWFKNETEKDVFFASSIKKDFVPVLDLNELLEIDSSKEKTDKTARIITLKNLQNNKRRIIYITSIKDIILLPKSYKSRLKNSPRNYIQTLKVKSEIYDILDIEKIFMTLRDN